MKHAGLVDGSGGVFFVFFYLSYLFNLLSFIHLIYFTLLQLTLSGCAVLHNVYSFSSHSATMTNKRTLENIVILISKVVLKSYFNRPCV